VFDSFGSFSLLPLGRGLEWEGMLAGNWQQSLFCCGGVR
jgi:hypothetical protein